DPAPPAAGPPPPERGRPTAGQPSWPARLARRAGTAGRLASLQAVVLAAIIAGSVLALLHTTTVGIQNVAVRQLDAELQDYQQALSNHPPTADLRTVTTAYLHSHAVAAGNLLEVSQPSSWAVANAGGVRLAHDPVIAALSARVPARTEVASRTVAGTEVEVMAAPVHQSGRPDAVFIAAVDLGGLNAARGAAVQLAAIEGTVALVAGVLGAYLLLRRLLRRIGGITDTAEAIGRGRLAERLGDQGTTDEVGELARSFDDMLDRIQAAVQAQEALLSDVSHQLRTPLTVARGHLEILQRSRTSDPEEVRETLDVAIGELDRMGRLVERLLVLGRAREPVRPDLHDVDLRSFLADFSASCRVLAERRWVLEPVPDAVARFDETEVRGALLNLVDNAVKVTGPGDTIAVSAAVDGPTVRISVADSGPGIPAADRESVLDRFSRTGHAPSEGIGLGLAIANAVCQAHGGRVEIADSDLGGASMTLVLQDPDGGRR
ncbi:MAG TPA: HAMP domain-containing sensor histidine kinase, partial [Acidimicrobiales bacterium]|nr:HAMP domain-containing sensor histidine kinase [Acidimicrobiales bacterium]